MRRSLRLGHRPSPLLWRVGTHIEGFGACSVFTARCGPRGSLAPRRGLFSECFSSCRYLVSRSECFRLERQLTGRVSHPGGMYALARRTQQWRRAATAARGRRPEKLALRRQRRGCRMECNRRLAHRLVRAARHRALVLPARRADPRARLAPRPAPGAVAQVLEANPRAHRCSAKARQQRLEPRFRGPPAVTSGVGARGPAAARLPRRAPSPMPCVSGALAAG